MSIVGWVRENIIDFPLQLFAEVFNVLVANLERPIPAARGVFDLDRIVDLSFGCNHIVGSFFKGRPGCQLDWFFGNLVAVDTEYARSAS
jgi:hypothetical protein